jgi:hypothetical protein
MELRQLFGQSHVTKLLDGSGRQAVATGLFARKRFLFDDEYVVSEIGKPICGGRTGRSASDDENFGGDVV